MFDEASKLGEQPGKCNHVIYASTPTDSGNHIWEKQFQLPSSLTHQSKDFGYHFDFGLQFLLFGGFGYLSTWVGGPMFHLGYAILY